MPAAGDNFLKIVSSNMQKLKNEVAWPEKVPLNFQILEPPSTFETPKVYNPSLIKGGGVRAMILWFTVQFSPYYYLFLGWKFELKPKFEYLSHVSNIYKLKLWIKMS